MERISVQLVVRNTMQTLPETMASLEAQSWKDLTVRIVDNGSSDTSSSFLRETYPRAMVMRNARNLGAAQALNQVTQYTLEHWPKETGSSQAILFVEPDVVLTPDCLEKLMRMLDEHPDVAAVGPKLLKIFEENILDEAFRERVESDHIASMGWLLTPSLDVLDRGVDEVDAGQYDRTRDVFGFSGACVLVRASAMEDICLDGAYFASELSTRAAFQDLAWRLHHAGWRVGIEPAATAYVYRGVYSATSGSSSGLAEVPFFQKRLVRLRNVPLMRWLGASPHWFFRELWAWVRALVLREGVWRTLALSVSKAAWTQRAAILKGRKGSREALDALVVQMPT